MRRMAAIQPVYDCRVAYNNKIHLTGLFIKLFTCIVPFQGSCETIDDDTG